MHCHEVLTHFVSMCQRMMGKNLVGVYLHGSLAMGCFNPWESDLDLLVVVDKDLAVHATISHSYGKVLQGQEIPQVFGEVPRAAYLDSIWEDISDAREEILTQTVYITLNLCRVLAYLREGLVLSKKAGGEWGLQAVPGKYHPFLRSALSSYGTDADMTQDEETAAGFAEFMLFAMEKEKASR